MQHLGIMQFGELPSGHVGVEIGRLATQQAEGYGAVGGMAFAGEGERTVECSPEPCGARPRPGMPQQIKETCGAREAPDDWYRLRGN